jgi:hypothetical protein
LNSSSNSTVAGPLRQAARAGRVADARAPHQKRRQPGRHGHELHQAPAEQFGGFARVGLEHALNDRLVDDDAVFADEPRHCRCRQQHGYQHWLEDEPEAGQHQQPEKQQQHDGEAAQQQRQVRQRHAADCMDEDRPEMLVRH